MLPNRILTRLLLLQSSSSWNSFLLFSRFGNRTKALCRASNSLSTSSSPSSSSLSSSHRQLTFGLLSSSRFLGRLKANLDKSVVVLPSLQTPKRQQLCAVSNTACNLNSNASSSSSSHRRIHSTTRTSVQYSKVLNASRSEASSSSKSYETDFELVEKESQLILHFGDEESRCLPLIWLRDQCRCQSCYNHNTNQKDNVEINLVEAGTLGSGGVSLEDGNTTLVIHWKDGHTSKYSVEWLMSNSYKGSNSFLPSAKKVLWNRDTLKDRGGPSPVSYTSHLTTEEGLRQTYHNLLDYGFSMITEAPVSVEDTQTATARVAPIQETFFGGMWEFTSDGAFSDTAFDSGYLSAHTDGTYFEIPPGIQVFQCLSHDGKGGETLLVDGFHAVETLRQSHPDAVRFLSTHLVPHEYKEFPRSENGRAGSPGYHMYAVSPVIKLHPATGDILHLRFNPYDRAPLNTIPPEDMLEFYRSYHLLSTIISDPKGHFWVKLHPGAILLIDNWRVMHGRSAFDGKRIMCGCYLRRDDWISRARILGLVD